jgi:hypothetical protein
VPFNQATMNLGFLDGGTAAHEFGHAIGLAHEHSSPAGGMEWNKPVVLRDLAGPPNFWDAATVAAQRVLQVLGRPDQRHRSSIPTRSCCTPSRPTWTVNGVSTHANDVLSQLDREFIAGAKMYPLTEPGCRGRWRSPSAVRWSRPTSPAGRGRPVHFRGRERRRLHGRDTRQDRRVHEAVRPRQPDRVDRRGRRQRLRPQPRIATELRAGKYFVQVRHYDRSSGTGKYNVQVKKR